MYLKNNGMQGTPENKSLINSVFLKDHSGCHSSKYDHDSIVIVSYLLDPLTITIKDPIVFAVVICYGIRFVFLALVFYTLTDIVPIRSLSVLLGHKDS